MKTIIRFLLLATLLQSFQCNEDESVATVTPQQLAQKKQEILDYINSYSCAEASGCNSIAFGAKPCGGPREFLVYPNSVDQVTLQNLVDEYYEMDNEYNIQTGAVSDCMVVTAPSNIDCVNGVCTIID
ncbi:hypothetical protein [Flavobacterium channae]|uniref:hypothetical protein n=1 Tax=Flavobacterium channae TaxID=2897181 RepID=UPI001E4FA877|nr:hypothetical protein [Flavobacterium channae]UGS23575.1 hypothetical protein LOS89_12565 [Flavobacterium channae]